MKHYVVCISGDLEYARYGIDGDLLLGFDLFKRFFTDHYAKEFVIREYDMTKLLPCDETVDCLGKIVFSYSKIKSDPV